jgi:hypothetical protein
VSLTQTVDHQSNVLEAQLLQELKSIEERISELMAEKATVQRLIVSVRRKNPALAKIDVTRKNSIKRVLTESVVLESIKNSTKPRKTHELYSEMLKVDSDLKESTFRSTLHRMKRRGVIFSPNDGLWEAPAPSA